MFFKVLFNYLFGYVNITIEGFFVERFINNCINKKIFLWGIKRKNGTLITANISIKEFKQIRTIVKKTNCKVNINTKKGFPIILHRYRKRKILVILLLPILVSVLISSLYIWNIEIVGLNNIKKEELVLQLKEEGIDIGKKKSSIDTKSIISNIRLKRDDISWMSVDLKGTNVIISIVESEKKPDMVDENKYCNIIADKKGIITKITADRGTIVAKVGDIIEKGDVLIGGYMEGKYTGTRYVHAKGDVRAKIWYTKKMESGFVREIIEETGNQKNIYAINFNNFKINLYKTLPNFENYDTINETKKIKLFNNFYLPIAIEKNTYIEQEKTKITYGKEELQEILISKLQEQFIQDGIENLNVTNKIVNFYDKNSSIEIEMTYEVEENIGIENEIEVN